MAFNFDMTLGELLEHKAAMEVLKKHLGEEILQHDMLDSVKHMTINQIRPYSDYVVTPELFAAIEAELNALG